MTTQCETVLAAGIFCIQNAVGLIADHGRRHPDPQHRPARAGGAPAARDAGRGPHCGRRQAQRTRAVARSCRCRARRCARRSSSSPPKAWWRCCRTAARWRSSSTKHEVAHSFELMAALEGLSGELAAQRITEAELQAIQALHFEMMAAFTRRDLSAYYRLNAQIHAAINAAAKNPVLARTYAQTNARLQALRFRSNQDERKWKRAVKEHSQMIDALAARDARGPARAADHAPEPQARRGARDDARRHAGDRRRRPEGMKPEHPVAISSPPPLTDTSVALARAPARRTRAARCCSMPRRAAAMPPMRRSTR